MVDFFFFNLTNRPLFKSVIKKKKGYFGKDPSLVLHPNRIMNTSHGMPQPKGHENLHSPR